MSPRGRLYRPGTQTLAYSFWRAPRPKEALRVVRTPIGRRKRNSPEVRSGGIKFDRRMKALGGLPRRPHHPAGHALLGPFMFKHKPRVIGKIPLQRDQRAVRVHAEGGHVESRRFPL